MCWLKLSTCKIEPKAKREPWEAQHKGPGLGGPGASSGVGEWRSAAPLWGALPPHEEAFMLSASPHQCYFLQNTSALKSNLFFVFCQEQQFLVGAILLLNLKHILASRVVTTFLR